MAIWDSDIPESEEPKKVKLYGCGNCVNFDTVAAICELGKTDRYETLAHVLCDDFGKRTQSEISRDEVFGKYFKGPAVKQPSIGDTRYDTQDGVFKTWNGDRWVKI